MKCTVCREPAVIDLRRHNSNFCASHFTKFCRDQTQKAIDEFDMMTPADKVLVAVSGGKDSLAVWDILLDLGYAAFFAIGAYATGLLLSPHLCNQSNFNCQFYQQQRETLVITGFCG